MCGICGILTISDPGADRRVSRMRAAMVHRGPDDAGSARIPFTAEGAFAALHLGFQRLAIIDTSTAGHQPMLHAATGNCLVFNGEIYNFRELRAALVDLGHHFVGDSDTEVVLHALTHWGAEALQRLRGMFACAFYEAGTQRVLLARDPLGIKPLYYHARTGELSFASEARALIAAGQVSGAMTSEGVAGFLAFGGSQEPATVYDGIAMLPAGTYAWIGVPEVRVGSVRPSTYWRVPRAESGDSRTTRDAATEVQQQLTRSIETHLVADVPVSVFLSSGVDSGIIAAVASRLTGPVDTFTVGFDLPGHRDEANGARETARLVGSRHHDVVIRTDDVPDLFASWLRSMDQPSIDGFNSFVVAGAVRAAGFKVALSGLGSDELFGGYPNFTQVAKLVRCRRWLRWLPRSLRHGVVSVAATGRSARTAEMWRDLYCGDEDASRLALVVRRIWSDAMIHAAIGRGLPAVGTGPDADVPKESLDYARVCELVSEAELTGYLRNVLLRDTDVYSMARSLEVRVPFLDTHVVECVRRMPPRLIFDRGKPGKHLLKMAFADLVPEVIFQRPKRGFSLPIGSWMKGPLRGQCDDAIGRLEASGLMKKSYPRNVWRDFLQSGTDGRWLRPMALVALGACMGRRPGRDES